MPFPRILRHCLLSAVFFAGAAGPRARAVELSAASPFLPPGTTADTAVSDNAPIELRGIVDGGGGDYKFDLCDAATHKGVWVGLNEPGQAFVVRSVDAAHDSVTVDYQGRQITLTLMQPKYISLPGATIVAEPGAMPPGMLSPTLNEQQRRSEMILQEIRRRRAMRQSAGQMPPRP